MFVRLDQLQNGVQFVNDVYLNRDRLQAVNGGVGTMEGVGCGFP